MWHMPMYPCRGSSLEASGRSKHSALFRIRFRLWFITWRNIHRSLCRFASNYLVFRISVSFLYSLFSALFSCIADCVDPSCSGHGTCINGQCYCKFLYRFVISSETLNHFVEQHDGLTLEFFCVCVRVCLHIGKAGWQGEDCSTVDQQVYQCLPGCSERGTYDLETGTCICERHWTGPDCSQGIYSACMYSVRSELPIDNGENVKWPNLSWN